MENRRSKPVELILFVTKNMKFILKQELTNSFFVKEKDEKRLVLELRCGEEVNQFRGLFAKSKGIDLLKLVISSDYLFNFAFCLQKFYQVKFSEHICAGFFLRRCRIFFYNLHFGLS